MAVFTHRFYFRRYGLNVAQYGEILVAEAFHGTKMGDVQRGYDIRVANSALRQALTAARLDAKHMKSFVQDNEVYIQVRSKLTETTSGKASVVHCHKSDLDAMTHLAVILVDPGSRISNGDPEQEGLITHAWLMTRNKAAELRKKKGEKQYIKISQLKNPVVTLSEDLIDIKNILAPIANARIELAEPATAPARGGM